MKKQYKLLKWYPSLPTSFKIGDKVVKLWGDCEYVSCNESAPYKCYPHEIENNPEFWEKVEEKEKPLFTTEDGEEAFEGDTYYAIDLKTYEVVWSIADECSLDSNWLKFSTKAKAERWVLENKPKYSVKNIKDALYNSRIFNDDHSTIQCHRATFYSELIRLSNDN